MDDAALSAVIAARLAQCRSLGGGQLAADRAEALRRYRGDPYGNEEEGQSRVVSRDVAEVVDGLMPGLMAVFVGGERVCVFEPHGPEDEAAAEQASDYVNWLLRSRGEAFRLFCVWFKDALLQRVGVVKSWWEVAAEDRTERYAGLSPEEAAALRATPDAVVVTETEAPDGIALTLRITGRRGAVRICNVPPEEFLIDARALDVESAAFVAHRCRKTVGELIAEGFDPDLVHALPTGSADTSTEAAVRRRPGEGLPDRDFGDEASRPVWVTESYIRIDADGDGLPELRKVVTGGHAEGTVLLNEPCADGQPFSTLTPTIMPHAFFGKSVADDVIDLAEIKTALMRQTLNNLYLTNMPEFEVVESQIVDWDELLTRRPGGIKRVKQAGAITPLAVPFVAQASFGMIDYADRVRAQRTGLRPGQGSLDPDALQNVAATTAAIVDDGAHAREELIARTFAETGVKHLMRRLLRLVCRYQDRAQMIRLRGRWVPMDPRGWNADMDMSCDVGLGTGSRTRRRAAMQALVGVVRDIVTFQGGVQGPIVTAANVYEVLRKYLESLDLVGIERFISDPAAQPPRPNPPPPAAASPPRIDPAVAKAQADLALGREKLAAEMALAREKLMLETELAYRKAGFDFTLKAQRQEADAAVKAAADER